MMERKPFKMALGWICFQVWTRRPCFNRAGMWLLGWAGYYAHATEKSR